MPRKRRGHKTDGHASSQLTSTQGNNSHTLNNPKSQHTVPKKTKVHLSPGRTVSIHNLLPAVNDTDISALLHSVSITSYKRVFNQDTGELSEVAFLLLGSVEDAAKVFLQLDGAQVLGQAVRVNFVNGIQFEDQTVEEPPFKSREDNTKDNDPTGKHGQGAGGTKGIKQTELIKLRFPPRYVKKSKAGNWFRRLFSWKS